MAIYRIKNWGKFQHFKDRRPPWVKLYRDILDDPDWHTLDPSASKVLVMLWLLASEDETQTGTLPDMRKLCFRLRISESILNQSLNKLSHWVEQVDIDTISPRYRSDAPETETETETETESIPRKRGDIYPEDFEAFWIAYPTEGKSSKAATYKAWKTQKINGHAPAVMKGLEAWKSSQRWKDKFIVGAAKFLSERRWESAPEQELESDWRKDVL